MLPTPQQVQRHNQALPPSVLRPIANCKFDRTRQFAGDCCWRNTNEQLCKTHSARCLDSGFALHFCLSSGFSHIAARSSPDQSSSFQGKPRSPAAVKHIGNGVYINSGLYGATIPAATFTLIDAAITVTCPGLTGTCLLQAGQWIQTGGGSSTSNEFALCFYVDGVSLPCYYDGSTPSDGSFVMGTVSQGISVAHGNHTVQTYIYSNNGAFMNLYTFTYRIYKT